MNTIVSVEWLSKHVEDSNLIILDASLKKNQANLHSAHIDLQIQKARYFDLKNTFSDQTSTIPNTMLSVQAFNKACQDLGINKDSQIVVYDNLGIYASPRVWWMFQLMGHSNIAVLDGGLPAWINANQPTEPSSFGIKIFTKGNFEANYQSKWMVNTSQIAANIKSGEALVIDARVQERFLGKMPEPRKNLRSGHIPKSLNLPFKKVLDAIFFKKKEELLDIVADLKLEQKSLIFSCGSGVTACIVLLALETVLNNPKALYDGSWSEWGLLD